MRRQLFDALTDILLGGQRRHCVFQLLVERLLKIFFGEFRHER